ncbi:hypothetical protein Q5752_001706 [Cryptotrichosporon argae]
MKYTGGCYCRTIRYEVELDSADDARTSLCHCSSCKKWFGGPFGITTKVGAGAFRYTAGQAIEHESDNGATLLHREFCGTCGSGILEYGKDAAGKFIYFTHGTLDDPAALAPKGEFFCKNRLAWMPELQGVFHKREIKE